MQNGKSGPPHLGVYCATPPVEKRTGYAASGRQRLDSDGIVRDATSITGKLGDQPSSVKRFQNDLRRRARTRPAASTSSCRETG
jgi:hypothetical protein